MCVNLQSSRVSFYAFVVARYLMPRNVLLRLASLYRLHQTYISQTFYTRVLLRLAKRLTIDDVETLHELQILEQNDETFRVNDDQL